VENDTVVQEFSQVVLQRPAHGRGYSFGHALRDGRVYACVDVAHCYPWADGSNNLPFEMKYFLVTS
jgi:hypothetical protein